MNSAEILMYYEMFDDDDISTERLLAMVADAAGCDIDDVVSALAGEHVPNYGKNSTNKKSNKNRRKRRKKT